MGSASWSFNTSRSVRGWLPSILFFSQLSSLLICLRPFLIVSSSSTGIIVIAFLPTLYAHSSILSRVIVLVPISLHGPLNALAISRLNLFAFTPLIRLRDGLPVIFIPVPNGHAITVQFLFILLLVFVVIGLLSAQGSVVFSLSTRPVVIVITVPGWV